MRHGIASVALFALVLAPAGLPAAAKDGDLIESPMVYRLAKPSTGDFSWVRPGKVAWDWRNDLNLRGVGFQAGVNTATYKYFIDFAAANGIEYVILDEGWYKLGDLLSVVPAVDMDAILARRKGTAWSVGAMTDAIPREFTLDLSFLDDRLYDVTIWQDGLNADRDGNDYAMVKKTLTRTEPQPAKLAEGGGWVAIMTPK